MQLKITSHVLRRIREKGVDPGVLGAGKCSGKHKKLVNRREFKGRTCTQKSLTKQEICGAPPPHTSGSRCHACLTLKISPAQRGFFGISGSLGRGAAPNFTMSEHSANHPNPVSCGWDLTICKKYSVGKGYPFRRFIVGASRRGGRVAA